MISEMKILEDLQKDIILTNLQFLNDEPLLTNLLFNFQTFADELSKILLDENIPTPFAIGLDGEWGSGKSTLSLRLKSKIAEDVKNDFQKNNWRTIYFNAWKYEKLDPVASTFRMCSLLKLM